MKRLLPVCILLSVAGLTAFAFFLNAWGPREVLVQELSSEAGNLVSVRGIVRGYEYDNSSVVVEACSVRCFKVFVSPEIVSRLAAPPSVLFQQGEALRFVGLARSNGLQLLDSDSVGR